jgi:outer membrane protein assembly factor BamB
MASRQDWISGLVVGLIVVAASAIQAAVVGGTFVEVGADQKTIVVNAGSAQKPTTFLLAGDFKVTIDGKPAKLTDVQAGQRVSVFTDASNFATMLSARSEAAAGATTSTPKPATTPSSTPAKPAAPPRSTTATNRPGPTGAARNDASAPWPQFRGPNRDGISLEKGLLKQWPTGGPKPLWVARGLGDGYSSVSVAGGKVLTMGTVNGQQAILAVSLDGGKPLWMTPCGAPYSNNMGGGPRSVPTIDGDRVYALGAEGDLVCAALDTGKAIWSTNILQQFGGSNIRWGICESPLVEGDLVICTPGGRQATVVAFNKQTGQPAWQALVPGTPEAGYASAIAVTAAGVRQIVQIVSSGTIGLRASDGNVLWGNEGGANGTANCSAPVFFKDGVFSASGYGTGGALVQLSSNGAQQVYRTKDMKNHHGGMVVVDGFLYGCDEGVLTCLEFATGKVVWQDRSVGKGSITYADGRLYVRSENGPMALVECTPQGYRELGRFDPPTGNAKSWAYPVVADGKLLLRDQDLLFCFDLKN